MSVQRAISAYYGDDVGEHARVHGWSNIGLQRRRRRQDLQQPGTGRIRRPWRPMVGMSVWTKPGGPALPLLATYLLESGSQPAGYPDQLNH